MTPQQPESKRQVDEAAAAASRSEWFYVQRGETYGPVSSTDLCAAAHLGFLGPDDMVRRSDRTDWVAARSVPGLFKKRA
jgi:hypothetical protein